MPVRRPTAITLLTVLATTVVAATAPPAAAAASTRRVVAATAAGASAGPCTEQATRSAKGYKRCRAWRISTGASRRAADPSLVPPPAPAPEPPPAPPAPPPVAPALPPLPAAAEPLDVSSPDSVVGDGTSASCTETAVRTAVAGGGVVVFDCGPGTVTIALTSPLVAPTTVDTVIDGANRIVLDGQGSTQILRAHHGWFHDNPRHVAVQRLHMVRGRSVGTGFVPRDGTRTCAWGYRGGGGGAISADNMNVRVYDVLFEDNHGPDLGPDMAGGAIYMAGSQSLTVANSTFRRNSASNGGAIGALHSSSFLHNSVFEDNRATGLAGNFAGATGCPGFNGPGDLDHGGAGGLGGAFYSLGFDPGDHFSGVRMRDNHAGHSGGAVHRTVIPVPVWAPTHSVLWESVLLEGNSSAVDGGGGAHVLGTPFTMRDVVLLDNAAPAGDGGGLLLTGVTVDAADVAFHGNRAVAGGGVAHRGGGPGGVGSSVRTRFTSNSPSPLTGDWPQ